MPTGEEKKPRKKPPTTRKGRAEASKNAMSPPALAQYRKEKLDEVRELGHGGLPVVSIKSLGKRIRETTDEGRFIYEVLRDILLDVTEQASNRIGAAKLLLERGWGKTPDILILEEVLHPTNVLRNFSTDELKRMLELAPQEGVIEGEVKELENALEG